MSISYLKKRKKKKKKKKKKKNTVPHSTLRYLERSDDELARLLATLVNDLVQLRNNANGETMKSEISTLSLKCVSFGSAHDHDVLFLLGDMQLHA